jgi:predicted nucleotidyltransferase
MDKDSLIKKLSEYFKERNDVSFAYLFGSIAKGTSHNESDIDVGVYFKPGSRELEYESNTEYANEDTIWSQIENLTKKQTDMVVLNRAPATLFDGVFRTGVLLYDDGSGLRMRLFLAITDAAEEFRDFVNDFYAIRERSRSLTPQDRERHPHGFIFGARNNRI